MGGVLVLRMRAAWRRRWPSFAAMVLLVAVSVGVTLVAVAGARRTRSAPARFMREDRNGDVWVEMQSLGSLRGVGAISSLPQVREVSVVVAVSAFPFSEAGVYMPLFAPVDGKGGVRTMRGLLLSGRRPDPRATDEIMLSEAHARTLDAHVGDRIPLVAFDEAQAKRCLYGDDAQAGCSRLFRTPRLSVRVVGIARTAADVGGRATDITVSVLSGGFFERHRAQMGWVPVLVFRLRPHVSAESFVAAARRALPAGVDANFEAHGAGSAFDVVDVLSAGLGLFALVAGLAGAFALGQAVVRQVRADDEGRAVLATLGATRRLLIADALTQLAAATIVGIGVALLGAYVASAWMPIGFARRIDPSRGREFDWLAVLGCIAAFVLIVAGAAVVAVLASRRRVATRATSRSLAVFVGQAPASAPATVGLWHACSPGRGRRSVPVRSALVGVTVATAGIIGVLGFSASLSNLVHSPRLYGWDFDVLGVNSDYTSRVISDPAVAAVADVRRGFQVRVNGRPTLGTSITPIVGDIGPATVAGRAPLARDEIAMGADTLHAARAHIGDTVNVAGPDGRLAMRVVGQAVFPTGADAYPLADGAVVAPAAVKVLGMGDESFHHLAIRYRPHVDRDAAFARLDALDATSDPGNDPPDRPVPPAEIDKLRQVETLPSVLAGFLALLGVVGLTHALVVGVRRRARNFAVLRALGFRGRDVRSAVAWEAGTLALAGTAVGVPLGILIARLAWARTARGIGVQVVDRIPAVAVLAAAPAAVMLAILIALFPARRAARLHPAEILRSE